MHVPVLAPDDIVLAQVRRRSLKIHKPHRHHMARCGYPVVMCSALPFGLLTTTRRLRYCYWCWR